MLPTQDTTVSVRSTRVIVDGLPVARTVVLDRADDLRVLSIGPHDAGTSDQLVDVGDAPVVPAPLDLHFHGAGGVVVPPDGSVADIDAALRAASAAASWSHASLPAPSYGWIATLPVPQTPPADPVEHLAAAATSIGAAPGGCSGLRIEGLFLNPERAGVWPPETFHVPDVGLLEQLHGACRDAGTPLRIIDIAPELPGAVALIERAVQLGIITSIAHSDATWDVACRAIDAGATLATHTWNAMRAVTHRDPGVVAAVLVDDRVTCELICDGVHLHPGMISLSISVTGPSRWIPVSDASPFAGCAPGSYDWAGTTVTHDGTALRDPAGHLAGSASLLDRAIQLLRSLGVSDVDVALAVGAVPRQLLDPRRSTGLQVGDPAWIFATT
jgi:N-acetylglucosamine-6-phosphate deacetylase